MSTGSESGPRPGGTGTAYVVAADASILQMPGRTHDRNAGVGLRF